MKFIHLSDLHLGKRVNEYSMLEDQEYILKKIINIVDAEKPDGVIIAGDVYDKSVPAAEAVQLFDNFLVQLAKRKLEVFVISGNHDSPERIAFGARIMDASGIHMSPVYDGNIAPISMRDGYGTVDVYGLKQIIYEPEERVCISNYRPQEKAPYHIIDSITITDNLFQQDQIVFNQNLTCIIGGKSTGKSILLHNFSPRKSAVLSVEYAIFHLKHILSSHLFDNQECCTAFQGNRQIIQHYRCGSLAGFFDRIFFLFLCGRK